MPGESPPSGLRPFVSVGKFPSCAVRRCADQKLYGQAYSGSVAGGIGCSAVHLDLWNSCPQLCRRAVHTIAGAFARIRASADSVLHRRRYCWEKTQFFRGSKVVKCDGVQKKNEYNDLLTGTIMVRRLKEGVLPQLPLKRRQQITLDSSRLDATIMSQRPSFLILKTRFPGQNT
jgi:hypothetical protein